MAYVLSAVVAAEPLLRRVADLPGTRVVPLAQGLAMLPLPDAVRAALDDGTRPFTGFYEFPGGLQHTLAAWSDAGQIAYIEADIFGGTGDQSVAVWTRGALTLGPLIEPNAGPISLALRHLGAHADGHHDEFDAVGLGRHRRTEAWLKDA
ncbi:hypothetical protein ACFYS8_29275 [Kitasatospora sp. NPDC004615]|uniref:hypothetical protein n=1 Tax=unclassified Kitasatospora TaxID=2633591 RepID=UPI0036CBCBFB